MNAARFAVQDLAVAYATRSGTLNEVVADMSVTIEPGEIVGLAGESGCGKSTTALAAIGYRSPGLHILSGSAQLGEIDLLRLGPRELRGVWGRHVGYVAQDAAAALNPALTIGRQLAQPMRRHLGLRGDAARERALALLASVELPDADRALDRYPHELSGGQQQRVAIAIALSCDPELIVLDEPTTGLDVTTQHRVSALLRALIDRERIGALYVSHDLAHLSGLADRLVVMYAGEVAERGPALAVARAPEHPYTRALLAAVPSARELRAVSGIPGSPPSGVVRSECSYLPRCTHAQPRCAQTHPGLEAVGLEHEARCLRVGELGSAAIDSRPGSERESEGARSVLEVRDLGCTYGSGDRQIAAVDGVSLDLGVGEILAIVGESGSGKSTLLRAIAGLVTPSSGGISLEGQRLAKRATGRPRSVQGRLQLIFQNPDSSLNPRHDVCKLVRRSLELFRPDVARNDQYGVVAELLDQVRLPRDVISRRPADLSGGQKQRVAIARAFAARPAVLLCDEVTSALDVSVQATVVELITSLSAEYGTAVLFVTHDLALVRSVAGRACVMQRGRIRETGSVAGLFAHPADPYTRELLAAVPELPKLSGSAS